MTNEEYWKKVTEKYPLLKEDKKVTIDSKGFKALIFQAYEKGNRRGFQHGILSSGAIDFGLRPDDPSIKQTVDKILNEIGL